MCERVLSLGECALRVGYTSVLVSVWGFARAFGVWLLGRLRDFPEISQWEANASPFVQAPILGNLRVLSMSEVPHRCLYI